MGCYHFLNFPLLLSTFTMSSNKSCRVNVKENSLATNCSSFVEQFYLCQKMSKFSRDISQNRNDIVSLLIDFETHSCIGSFHSKRIRISAAFIRE